LLDSAVELRMSKEAMGLLDGGFAQRSQYHSIEQDEDGARPLDTPLLGASAVVALYLSRCEQLVQHFYLSAASQLF